MKIAPTLRKMMADPWESGWHPYPSSKVAGPALVASRQELESLLAVARAAQRAIESKKSCHIGLDGRPDIIALDGVDVLIRALARLERVSGGGKK